MLEQDHRGVKGRYRPMRGFKEFGAAHRFCRAFDEVRNFLRPAHHVNQDVSLAHRRAIHVRRVAAAGPDLRRLMQLMVVSRAPAAQLALKADGTARTALPNWRPPPTASRTTATATP
jgi:hypothetical protein